MKTIQELYSEIMASQELKAQFIEAAKAGKQEEFLKTHGCEATLQEDQAFLEAKQQADAPLSLDEMENAAGGVCAAGKGVATSAWALVVGCAVVALASAIGGHVGEKKEGENPMCTMD